MGPEPHLQEVVESGQRLNEDVSSLIGELIAPRDEEEEGLLQASPPGVRCSRCLASTAVIWDTAVKTWAQCAAERSRQHRWRPITNITLSPNTQPNPLMML
ncbi:hypothetical protein EYF80_044475 [Liparis tanakae]|uniref:Uncharacterized protein n=1 Tax=Liparis tanakae TaxID=230148 RepID=A0A4Z2FXS2_9TELE|nr:hypothetical protein EYF80_044475 [Liparis tanakae]